MKSTLALLVLLLLAASCSSTEKPATTLKKEDVLQEKDFDDIENSDFDETQKVEVYSPSKDRYVLPNVTLNRAQQESTDLIKAENLEVLSEHDKLAELINECRHGEMEKFKGRVQKIKKSYAKNPAFWNIIASCYINKRDWPKAKIFIERALATVNNYVPALNNYAVLQSSRGDDQVALQLFLQASKGTYVVPKINLALLYLKYFHAQKAMDTVAGIQGEPHWKLLAIKGTSAYMLGKWESAIGYFQAIKSGKDFEQSNFNVSYSLSLLEAGKKDEARDQYLKGADHYKLSEESVAQIQSRLGI